MEKSNLSVNQSCASSAEYFPNVIKRSVELGYSDAEANFNYSNFAVSFSVFILIFGIVTTAIAMIFIRTKKSKQ